MNTGIFVMAVYAALILLLVGLISYLMQRAEEDDDRWPQG